MAKHATKDIRSVAFVGHGTAGKTTLVEAMLFHAKATGRQGRIEDGSSHLDFEAEEKERKYTIDLALGHCTWKGRHLYLVDSPGYPDFVGEALAALDAADCAVFCVDANAGIKVNTRKLWDYAAARGIPRLIVLTRLDMEHARFNQTLERMQERFGQRVIPLAVPDGEGAGFTRIAGTLSPPADAPDSAGAWQEKLLEAVIEVDDALLERYFAGEEIPKDELLRTFTRAIVSEKIFPVIPTSIEKGIGVSEVLDAIADLAPSPIDRPRRAMAGEEEKEIGIDDPFSAFVFKSVYDPFVGKVTYLRVVSGHFTPGNPFTNLRSERQDKIGHIYATLGKDQKDIDEAIAGDIIAVAKIDDIRVGDTVTVGGNWRFSMFPIPTPLVSLAVEPKTRGDEQKVSEALSKLAESDPTFRAQRDKQTGDMVISGLSDLHLQVVLSRLKRRFELDLHTRQPKVPYLETITNKATAVHRHKKQTGGRGQFAEVHLRVEPLERSQGFEFSNAVVGGSIPSNFIPAVEKGLREAVPRGIQAGFPVVDLKVTVFDGKAHDVDSSEAAFKLASSKAFRKAAADARPVLLEPIYNIETIFPDEFMGAITGDLNARRARIQGMDSGDGVQIIRAQVPLAEIQSYSSQLRSMTGGEGTFSIEFSHYDILPPPMVQPVIAKYGPKEEADEG